MLRRKKRTEKFFPSCILPSATKRVKQCVCICIRDRKSVCGPPKPQRASLTWQCRVLGARWAHVLPGLCMDKAAPPCWYCWQKGHGSGFQAPPIPLLMVVVEMEKKEGSPFKLKDRKMTEPQNPNHISLGLTNPLVPTPQRTTVRAGAGPAQHWPTNKP